LYPSVEFLGINFNSATTFL